MPAGWLWTELLFDVKSKGKTSPVDQSQARARRQVPRMKSAQQPARDESVGSGVRPPGSQTTTPLPGCVAGEGLFPVCRKETMSLSEG